MHSFDVVIVGGGIVGLTLACGLQGSGLRLAIVEQQVLLTADLLPEQPGLRVSAMNVASERLLQRIGVWETIRSLRVTPYRSMSVWDQDSFGRIRFQAEDYGHSHLGHIIENQVIQQALWQQVQQLPEVQIFSASILKNIAWGESEAFLTLQDGRMLSSRLVVGADGAHSWLRQHADIPLTFRDYEHHALVATVRTALPHQGCARQSFHGDGILAFLPLWDADRCSIVWSLPPERAQAMGQIAEGGFNRQLAVALDMQLGLCTLESERLILPLTARYARSFADHRLVLVGDAAHTIHPLAGQGVNLGLMDVAELIVQLKRLHREGKDIGQHFYLRRYERRRKYSAAVMLASMQGFHDLFAGTHPLKKLLRGIGLIVAEHAPGVKSQLARQAMGLYDLSDWLEPSRFD